MSSFIKVQLFIHLLYFTYRRYTQISFLIIEGFPFLFLSFSVILEISFFIIEGFPFFFFFLSFSVILEIIFYYRGVSCFWSFSVVYIYECVPLCYDFSCCIIRFDILVKRDQTMISGVVVLGSFLGIPLRNQISVRPIFFLPLPSNGGQSWWLAASA